MTATGGGEPSTHGPIRDRPRRAEPCPANTQMDPVTASQAQDIPPTPEEADMDTTVQVGESKVQLSCRELGSFKDALDSGWELVDAGGSGDCGFRAIVAALYRQQNQSSMSFDECKSEAAWFRTLMTAHIEKHFDRFESVLVRDRDVAPEELIPCLDTNLGSLRLLNLHLDRRFGAPSYL